MLRGWSSRLKSILPILLACLLVAVHCASRPAAPPTTTLPTEEATPSLSPRVSPSPPPRATAPPPPRISPSPSPRVSPTPPPPHPFAFAVTVDMRIYAGPNYDSPHYFRGACEAIAAQGDVAFMVSPGDVDPPADVRWTLDQTLGPEFPWFPAVGNHEVETPEDMAWLRAYDYGPVNPGPAGCPETTYSFDYENAHFVVLNEYCDVAGDAVTDGDIRDHLYDWLAADLAATDRPHIFIFGHEPAYPQPDADNGRERHMEDSLNAHPDNRDRFWDLLRDEGAVAYICGHTHNYSRVRIGGVWQLDAGHARGLGDTGARSTFLIIRVEGETVVLETYRDDAAGGVYTLTDAAFLAGGSPVYLPLVAKQQTPDV